MAQLLQISEYSESEAVKAAARGLWGAGTYKDQDNQQKPYVVQGRIVFFEGSGSNLPVKVHSKHIDSNGGWGILKQ